MIGADFLKSIDAYYRIRSALMIRFMDDIFIFDDNRDILEEDFLAVQRFLGERGFSLNAEKTLWGEGPLVTKTTIDDVKVQLLEMRREALEAEYGELVTSHPEQEAEEIEPLTDEQLEYLKSLLAEDDIDEADAELVLAVIGERATDHLQQLVEFMERFPALARSVYGVAKQVGDISAFAGALLKVAKTKHPLTEDQLFWMAKIAEDHLLASNECVKLLQKLYTHPAATELTKAKVLEVPHVALNDVREKFLKGGRSDWLAWAAAMGTRQITNRNATIC